MKSLGVEKCDNFILFNQDLSNLGEFSIPKVSGKTRFWGNNVMPQTVDTSNVSNIDEKSEINNLNFDKTIVTLQKNLRLLRLRYKPLS